MLHCVIKRYIFKMAFCCVVLFYVVICRGAMLFYVMLGFAMLCVFGSMLCYVTLCYVMAHYIVLFCVILYVDVV